MIHNTRRIVATCGPLLSALLLPFMLAATTSAAELKHVVVYRQPGRFGGWPANHGIWAWGDELLVGFAAGYMKDNGPDRHAIDHDRPEEHLLARSLDGGLTWTIENPGAQGVLVPQGKTLHGTPVPGLKERAWIDCPGGIEFTHPDFAMTLRMTDTDCGPSRFYWSKDRGHSWRGPYGLPLFGQPGVAARTDYIVNGPADCLLFLTAAKSDRQEGRPFCAGTTDGGRTWDFVGWIGPEPSGYAIMPSTVRIDENTLLAAIRRNDEPRHWIDAWLSGDNGHHWELVSTPAPNTGSGNPASLQKLPDGRVVVIYGVRAAPFGIRARISHDSGRTWGKEIILRGDGGGRDLGYPVTRPRADGKLVTVYYFNDDPKTERYIAATIWDPREFDES